MTISKDKSSLPASSEHAESKRESSLEDELQDCAAAWKRATGHLSVEGEGQQKYRVVRIKESKGANISGGWVEAFHGGLGRRVFVLRPR